MSQNRKLKSTIETTLKKIEELDAEFNDLWNRVYSAETQAQKEKYEGDLKKQMKKLQRQRDILKQWIQNADSTIAPFIDRLNSTRKTIEEKMTRFKQCEKETKTKAYSKEGLRQPSKQTPEDEKREGVQNELRRQISELKKEIDECEVEENQERNRKKNMNQEVLNRLSQYIQTHKKYISNMELILRRLDNHIITPYDVLELIDGIDDYIKSYREPDYPLDESLFDEFDLNDSSEESDLNESLDDDTYSDSASVNISEKTSVPTGGSASSASSASSANSASSPNSIPVSGGSANSVNSPNAISTPTPLPTPAVPNPSTPISTPPALTSTLPQLPITNKPLPVNSVWKKPLPKSSLNAKPLNYSEIIQRAPKSQTQAKPSDSGTVVSDYLSIQPTFVSQRFANYSWTRFETCDSLLYAIVLNAPPIESVFSEKPYVPKKPVVTPEGFPQVPVNMYNKKPTLGMPLDVAFFTFAMKQNEYSQYLAARVLQQNGWRFEKKTHKWYSRISQPKKNEKGEECFDMSVFDYAVWKITEVHDVVLSELEFEEELLP